MKRYAVALVLAGILGAPASAQPPLAFGPPPPTPPQPVLQGPPPSPGGPVTAFGAGFYRSGGIFVGNGGYFPYDTGTYLLAGSDGLARSSGVFTMVAPSGGDAAPAGGGRCRLFRR